MAREKVKFSKNKIASMFRLGFKDCQTGLNNDWENQIDQSIYQLYNLTEEEIAIVENASKQTNK